VIGWPFGGDGRFMLRPIWLLAGGLMFIAVTLDFAFGQLQSRQPRVADPLAEHYSIG